MDESSKNVIKDSHEAAIKALAKRLQWELERLDPREESNWAKLDASQRNIVSFAVEGLQRKG
jgi:hypothetical protein